MNGPPIFFPFFLINSSPEYELHNEDHISQTPLQLDMVMQPTHD